MAEQVLISKKEELRKYREMILCNMQKNVSVLRDMMEITDPFTLFYQMKYDKISFDPLSGKAENFIEVINQLQTYLVSVLAVEYLLDVYPEKAFTVNWGNISGYDIVSEDGEVIAECFAATSYQSNGKLTSDLKRLQNNTTASNRYEFFFDKVFTDKNRTYYEKKYPGVTIVKFQDLNVMKV